MVCACGVSSVRSARCMVCVVRGVRALCVGDRRSTTWHSLTGRRHAASHRRTQAHTHAPGGHRTRGSSSRQVAGWGRRSRRRSRVLHRLLLRHRRSHRRSHGHRRSHHARVRRGPHPPDEASSTCGTPCFGRTGGNGGWGWAVVTPAQRSQIQAQRPTTQRTRRLEMATGRQHWEHDAAQ